MKSPDRDAADEHMEAIILANRILDRVNADPDDDVAVLARQFLRSEERASELATLRRRVAEMASLVEAVRKWRLCPTQAMDYTVVDAYDEYLAASPLPPGRNEG